MVWNQQYTTNDVWSAAYPNGVGNSQYRIDRDVGASPTLFSACRCGKRVDLVAATSKGGFLRAFKRKNGKPVWQNILTYVPANNGNPGTAYTDEIGGGVLFAGYNDDPGPSIPAAFVINFLENPTPEQFIQLLTGYYVSSSGPCYCR